jgi:hypothetical protein
MPSHGGPGGSPTVIELADDEYITEISGKYGIYFGAVHICELEIRTNKKTHDKLGSTHDVHGAASFVFKAESGEAIVALSGRSFRHTDDTEYLSALGVTIQGG